MERAAFPECREWKHRDVAGYVRAWNLRAERAMLPS
jgi:hypothetical protein